MIKQECIGIPDMILLLMIFCFKKIKIKAEIVLSPGGAYFLILALTILDPQKVEVYRLWKRQREYFSVDEIKCREFVVERMLVRSEEISLA